MPDTPSEIAPGVARYLAAIVNLYFIGPPGSPWILLDTGMPGFAPLIKAAAEARYGPGTSPEAIILTHGHFDHSGNALALADIWDVPVYAHPMERPYLTGQSPYPPFDPTVGGFLPFLSRTFPKRGMNIGKRLRDLPDDGVIPGTDQWRWIATPGHAPGHVSLFRNQDRVLLAGDAFVTVNTESLPDLLAQKQEIVIPPAFAVYDWEIARKSVETLAGLNPSVVATGHGIPMSGPPVAGQLQALAAHFQPPAHGRYVTVPAQTDGHGIVSAPPPASDPVGVGMVVGAAAIGVGLLARRNKK